MSDIGILFICVLPCVFSLLCLFTVISRWGQRNHAQRAMGALLLVVFLASFYFFIFQFPSFRRNYRLDWLLTGLLAFLPVTYYLFIRKLTGTGRRSTLIRAYSYPIVLTFINVVLYMAMGDKGSGDYLEQVKLAWPVDFSALPVLWKVKYIFSTFIFRLVVIYQAIMAIGVTYKRIARFHSELKDYYADAETKLFRSGATLRISGITFLISMILLSSGPYFLYSLDMYYVLISVTVMVVSILFLTAYCLHQPISAEALSVMAEETKNMGLAMKNNSSLKDRLAAAIEDEFYASPDVTIMSLSEKIGTNRAFLSDLIHVSYGMSFADMVNDLRIKKAIKEMRSIPLSAPLTKIANMCGYSSYSEFAHNFEKFAHLTPSEWMKRYR